MLCNSAARRIARGEVARTPQGLRTGAVPVASSRGGHVSSTAAGFSTSAASLRRYDARFELGAAARRVARVRVAAAAVEPVTVKAEGGVKGMTAFLDSLKFDANGLVAIVVQNVDTGEICMQAFADRAALNETMQTGLATFYSRSRKERWCKGETSGNFIHVYGVFADCDKDSIIYLSEPIGPSCHTGARTCWFSEVRLGAEEQIHIHGDHKHTEHTPATTLMMLERVIQERRVAMEAGTEGPKPSWTARLLANEELLCKKIREEAGELCETLEKDEGKERAASEMADLLYHAMVLLNKQVFVLTCMKARLHPNCFLGLNFGDAHVIRNAGGRASDDALRSIIVSQRLLGTTEVHVIHNTDCGMLTFSNDQLRDKIKADLGVDVPANTDYLPFSDVEKSVLDDVHTIQTSNLITPGTPVFGHVYDVKDGKIKPVA